MANDDVLVSITASRKKGEIVYRAECANSLTNEEFEYYLEELIKGICKWKPSICDGDLRSFRGKIRQRKKVKGKDKPKK